MDSLECIESVEALSWLEKADGKERDIRDDPDTLLDLEASLRLVREIYDAGATEVLAVNVIIGDDFEFGQGIRVILPQDPAKQEALYTLGLRVLQDIESSWDEVVRNGKAFDITW